jgi:hypothetical protein
MIRQDIYSVIYIDLGYPDKFAVAAGIIVALMQSVAGRLIFLLTIFTLIARHMMADKDSLTGVVFIRLGLDDLAGDLVAENSRGLFDPVPFHYVGAADSAGPDLYQDFPWSDFWLGELF